MTEPHTPQEPRPDTFVIDEWQTMMRFVGFTPSEIQRVKELADFLAQQRIDAMQQP